MTYNDICMIYLDEIPYDRVPGCTCHRGRNADTRKRTGRIATLTRSRGHRARNEGRVICLVAPVGGGARSGHRGSSDLRSGRRRFSLFRCRCHCFRRVTIVSLWHGVPMPFRLVTEMHQREDRDLQLAVRRCWQKPLVEGAGGTRSRHLLDTGIVSTESAAFAVS